MLRIVPVPTRPAFLTGAGGVPCARHAARLRAVAALAGYGRETTLYRLYCADADPIHG